MMPIILPIKLQKVFGIFSIVIAYKVNNNIKDVLNKSLEIMDKTKHTFKVVTKRADKSYPIHSMDYSKKTRRAYFKKFRL